MNVYQIHWRDSINIHINDPCWEQSEPLRLIYGWAGSTQPETTAAMFWNQNGIVVRFRSSEHPVTVRYRNHNDPVNRDSCVEIFLNPNELEDNRYLNFELNAAGLMHLQFGDEVSREDIVDVDFRIFHIQTRISDSGWDAKLVIPFSFLRRYYAALLSEWRINLYKCGDRTTHPHYLCWAKIPTEKPNFHQSKYFGRVCFER